MLESPCILRYPCWQKGGSLWRVRVNRKQDSIEGQKKVSGQAGREDREEHGSAGDPGIHILYTFYHFLLSSHYGFYIAYTTLYHPHLAAITINRTITMV